MVCGEKAICHYEEERANLVSRSVSRAMMKRIVLCTRNRGKVEELREMFPADLEALTLDEVGVYVDLPETGSTLEENALQKAEFVHELTGLACVADDSGLEVYALNGAPGVDSAHYAGAQRNTRDNILKLLHELGSTADRRARFRTVIAWVDGGTRRLFQGTVEGNITHMPSGMCGFGYDPIFVPAGEERTFAEMSTQEKNGISHRSIAMGTFRNFLERRE